MSKAFTQKLRVVASETDDLLSSCDASDLLDGLEVARDFMFEAANEIEQLESRLAQAERECDAAVSDLENVIGLSAIVNLDCEFCKHMDRPTCEECDWEWRGICPENTKEDA